MNLSLGRIKGIKIQIHFTFWLIVIWGASRYGSLTNLEGLAYGAFITLLLFLVVLLHELGHSFAALSFGIPVRDITLLPIGGVARLERMPDKPVQEFIVALAGPAVNVVLAVLLAPIFGYLIESEIGFRLFNARPQLAWGMLLRQALDGFSLIGIVAYLFIANLYLLIFNMIPAFPLDGGRVFRSLLAMWIDSEKATWIAVWVGRTFAVLIGLWGLSTGNFFTAIIALFIFSAGGFEGRAATVRRKLKGISVRQALSRVGSTVLQPNFTMMEVASITMYSHQKNFPVMLGDALLGVVRRQDIRKALERGHNYTTVSEVMDHDVPKLSVDTSLIEAQEQLARSKSQVAAVYEDLQFVGLLSFDDIERAFYAFSSRGGIRPQTA